MNNRKYCVYRFCWKFRVFPKLGPKLFFHLISLNQFFGLSGDVCVELDTLKCYLFDFIECTFNVLICQEFRVSYWYTDYYSCILLIKSRQVKLGLKVVSLSFLNFAHYTFFFIFCMKLETLDSSKSVSWLFFFQRVPSYPVRLGLNRPLSLSKLVY